MKNMKKKIVYSWLRRVLPCLLALLLALGSAGCACTAAMFATVADGVRALVSGDLSGSSTPAAPGEDAPKPPAQLPEPPLPQKSESHENIPFSEMAYVRPDTDALADLLAGLLADAQGTADSKRLLDRYDEVLARFNEADSQLSLCYVYYAHDVTDPYYQEEYAWLQAELTELDLAMSEVSLALLERDEAAARARWGDEYADAVLANAALNDEEIQPLLEQEQALVQSYDELLASFVLREDGRTYTPEQIAEVAAQDYDEYLRLYTAYDAALNAEAGQIYLKLLRLRNEMAGKLGYGSYAAYMYDCYGRDYTVTDARAFHTAVKEYLVPVYWQLVMRAALQDEALPDGSFALEPYLEELRAAAADFSPLLLEALDYMLTNGLYDFEDNDNKMQSSFTTYFSSYNAPFMFTAWEGSHYNTRTVIHELGHYANYYHNPAVGWSVADPLDLAEVDSQGLELLMIPYYSAFYGEAAGTAELEQMVEAVYAVISGCMEDELQQEAYANPGMTLEELNAVYLRLAEEYGFADLYGFVGTEWVKIPHTFQTPMYYISYATSMVPALELWELSRTDEAAARSAYWSILQRDAYAQFRETVQANGLADPLSPDTIRHLAQVLEETYGF